VELKEFPPAYVFNPPLSLLLNPLYGIEGMLGGKPRTLHRVRVSFCGVRVDSWGLVAKYCGGCLIGCFGFRASGGCWFG